MLFGLTAVPTADLLELTDAQIVEWEWSLGDRNVINVVQFNYDFDTAGSVAQFGTRETFEQSASINKYGRRSVLLINSRGIKTANGGAAIALNRARGVIDRFTEPPLILRLSCFYQKHLLEAGDQVRITHATIPNPLTGAAGLTRDLFEIMDVMPDFARGRMRLTCLFLSAVPPQLAPASTGAISTPGVRVDITPPAVPAGLAVATTSDLLADGTFIGIADVTWTANTESDLSHYRLRWRKQGAAAFQELTVSAAASPRSIIRELSPNTIYEVQVAAVDFFLNASAFTASAIGTTPADPGIPAVPTGLALTAFPLAVALVWTKNAESDIAAYDLQRADDAAFMVNATVRSVDVTAFVDKVGDTVTRFYRVRAVRRTGAFSAYSAAVSGAGLQIGTSHIGTAVIDATKLMQEFSALADNAGFELGDVAWTKDTGWAVNNDAANARSGSWVAVFTGGTAALRNALIFKVDPNQQYLVSGWLKTTGAADGTGGVRVSWLDAAKNEVTTSLVIGAAPGATYVQRSGFVTAPAAAIFGRLEGVVFDRTVGTWFLDDVFAARAVTSDLVVAGAIVAGKIAANAITAAGAEIADATITTAKIADLNVTTAKIAALAVDAAKIATATITQAKMAAASIGTAEIIDGNITNAKIGSLAVTTAKITDLTITTLKIAGAAVNAMGQSQTAARVVVNVQTETTIESLSFTPNNTNSEIEVYVKVQWDQDDVSSGNDVTFRIKRDSTVLDTTVLDLKITGEKKVFMATVKETSPGVSAVTYALTVQLTGGTAGFANRLLRVAESKK